MLRCGLRSSKAAESPKLLSPSTSTTECASSELRATPRLTAIVLLPMPPFAPNTAMIIPRGPSAFAGESDLGVLRQLLHLVAGLRVLVHHHYFRYPRHALPPLHSHPSKAPSRDLPTRSHRC